MWIFYYFKGVGQVGFFVSDIVGFEVGSFGFGFCRVVVVLVKYFSDLRHKLDMMYFLYYL